MSRGLDISKEDAIIGGIYNLTFASLPAGRLAAASNRFLEIG